MKKIIISLLVMLTSGLQMPRQRSVTRVIMSDVMWRATWSSWPEIGFRHFIGNKMKG